METVELQLSLFSAGLGIGLLFALGTRLSLGRSRALLQKEIENLQNHLHTHMSIHAKGYEEVKQEVDRLKQENQNLRITIATLSNKPGRAELKMLHTWEKAIKILTLKSPVFAPAWEMAVLEAKKEMDEADVGMKSLVRKVFSFIPQEQTPSS